MVECDFSNTVSQDRLDESKGLRLAAGEMLRLSRKGRTTDIFRQRED